DATAVGLQTAHDLGNKNVKLVTGQKLGARLWLIGTYLPKAQSMPLGDIRVRQALNLAIDRKAIISKLFYGMAEMPEPPRAGLANADMTPTLRDKWRAWSAQNYRYDPDEAKRLIKEAGYANSSLEVWVAPDATAPWLNDLMLVVADYWKQAGLTS